MMVRVKPQEVPRVMKQTGDSGYLWGGGGRGEQLGKRGQGPSKAGILMLMCTQGHPEFLLTSGFSFSAFLVGAEGLHFLQAPRGG